MFKDKSVNEMM